MPTSAKTKTAAAIANPAARPLKKGDHLFLVDGSGYIFRAYHALPPLTRKSDGLQVNAVLGFCNMLWKLVAEIGEAGPGDEADIAGADHGNAHGVPLSKSMLFRPWWPTVS